MDATFTTPRGIALGFTPYHLVDAGARGEIAVYGIPGGGFGFVLVGAHGRTPTAETAGSLDAAIARADSVAAALR